MSTQGPARRPDLAPAADALREAERAILARGPEPRVTSADVERLAPYGRAPDRAEAEALFDIADATATAHNDAAFADLFARALASHVLRAASPGPRLAAFLESLAAETQGAADRLADEAFRQANLRSEARLAAAAAVDAGPAQWVVNRLARGGPLSEAERRLVARLREQVRVAA